MWLLQNGVWATPKSVSWKKLAVTSSGHHQLSLGTALCAWPHKRSSCHGCMLRGAVGMVGVSWEYPAWGPAASWASPSGNISWVCRQKSPWLDWVAAQSKLPTHPGCSCAKDAYTAAYGGEAVGESVSWEYVNFCFKDETFNCPYWIPRSWTSAFTGIGPRCMMAIWLHAHATRPALSKFILSPTPHPKLPHPKFSISLSSLSHFPCPIWQLFLTLPFFPVLTKLCTKPRGGRCCPLGYRFQNCQENYSLRMLAL